MVDSWVVYVHQQTVLCFTTFLTIGDDDQKGALRLLYHLLCVHPKKGQGDMSYMFAEYEVRKVLDTYWFNLTWLWFP